MQERDGAWRLPARDRRSDQQDHAAEATALCLVGLVRFQGRSRYGEQIEKAAVWLCNAQRNDGAWSVDGRADYEDEPNLLTTAKARHALVASGLQDARGHIVRANAFLLSEQHPIGWWVQKPWWPNFVTTIVLESLATEWSDIPPNLINQYLRAARELLPRSQKLLESSEPSDWRLGIIALYHGVEALMYGCFINPHLQLSIWHPKQSGQTIGLREAITTFRERHSVSNSTGQVLKYEQQLRTVASLRDGVIHRSDEVSNIAATEALRDVAAFICTHADELLSPGVSIESIWPDAPRAFAPSK